MTVLLTADTHFTSNPRDEYRWGLFPWMHKQVKKTGAKSVMFLGDLTDAKDRHPSELVNRLVSEMESLAAVTHVVVLRGNHDYIDINLPFFQFIARHHNIDFITQPTYMEVDDGLNGSRNSKLALFLPNTRDYRTDWKDLPNDKEAKKLKYIFCHQTFDGCEAENGTHLPGIPPGYFADWTNAQVWSGDIHVAQKLGPNGQVKYVGAPYRLRFGDSFKARVVLLKNGQNEDLHFSTIGKELITLKRIDRLKTYDFPEGTQVKVRMQLHRVDFPLWKEYKRTIVGFAAKRSWELFGPELVSLPDEVEPDEAGSTERLGARRPVQVLKAYAKKNNLEKELTSLGVEVLKEAQ